MSNKLKEEEHIYCTYELKNEDLCGKKVFEGEHCKRHSNKLKVSKCCGAKEAHKPYQVGKPETYPGNTYCLKCGEPFISAPTPKKERKIKACLNCKKLKRLADCYAKVIEAVYDGERIEDADKRIRKSYEL